MQGLIRKEIPITFFLFARHQSHHLINQTSIKHQTTLQSIKMNAGQPAPAPQKDDFLDKGKFALSPCIVLLVVWLTNVS
jgi:hypothetical protein